MRVFFNEKKERVAYYFDITLNNGIDEENLIPYYNDLFLDVTIEHGILKVLDEDELADALNTNVITKKDYDLANTTKDKLVESIKSNNNKYMKMDLESYLI